jgi:hypothetical protein
MGRAHLQFHDFRRKFLVFSFHGVVQIKRV